MYENYFKICLDIDGYIFDEPLPRPPRTIGKTRRANLPLSNGLKARSAVIKMYKKNQVKK